MFFRQVRVTQFTRNTLDNNNCDSCRPRENRSSRQTKAPKENPKSVEPTLSGVKQNKSPAKYQRDTGEVPCDNGSLPFLTNVNACNSVL